MIGLGINLWRTKPKGNQGIGPSVLVWGTSIPVWNLNNPVWGT